MMDGTTVFFLISHLLLIKNLKGEWTMKQNQDFPSREELDQAFHFLHDQINRISVVEEVEMLKKEKEGLEE